MGIGPVGGNESYGMPSQNAADIFKPLVRGMLDMISQLYSGGQLQEGDLKMLDSMNDILKKDIASISLNPAQTQALSKFEKAFEDFKNDPSSATQYQLFTAADQLYNQL